MRLSRFAYLRRYVLLRRLQDKLRQRLSSWSFDCQLLLQDIHHATERPLRWATIFLVCMGLSMIILEYGVELADLEADLVHQVQALSFWGCLSVFLLRLGLISRRREFLRQRLGQTLLVVFFLVNLLLLHLSIGHYIIWALFPALYTMSVDSLSMLMIQGFLLSFTLFEGAYYSRSIALWHLRPAQALVLSFATLILLGSLALMLPRATTTSTPSLSFLDALFTATSAVCVTGLAVVDTATVYSRLGQGIILVLFQIGGLGILTFALVFSMMLRGGLGVRDRLLVQDFSPSKQFGEIGAIVLRAVWLTFLLEGLGVVSLYWCFQAAIPESATRLWFALFHAVSAFCNAGFSIFGEGLAHPAVAMHAGVNVTIMLLIVCGGLGFAALWEGWRWISARGRRPRFSVQSSLVWLSTGVLIVVGAAGFLVLEHQGVLAGRPWNERLLGAFFQSVTARTAGYNTLAVDQLAAPTVLMMVLLMFVGASPGSTGGGIKTTTGAVLLLTAASIMRGKARVEIFRRTISWKVINQAYSTSFFAITVLAISLFILTITESQSFLDLLFEEVSAFGTVGLSRGITPQLTPVGKVVIILSMFVGRVGSLTLAVALARQVSTTAYEYPTEPVMVG